MSPALSGIGTFTGVWVVFVGCGKFCGVRLHDVHQVARARGIGAEWGRGSEVGAVMVVKEGVQLLVGGVT